MSFQDKYLKYKLKYLNLKQHGGQYENTNILFERINSIHLPSESSEYSKKNYIENIIKIIINFENKLGFFQEISKIEGGDKKLNDAINIITNIRHILKNKKIDTLKKIFSDIKITDNLINDILSKINDLRKINQLGGAFELTHYTETKECCICFKEGNDFYTHPIVPSTADPHIFCIDCGRALIRTHQRECPICREPFNIDFRIPAELALPELQAEQAELVMPDNPTLLNYLLNINVLHNTNLEVIQQIINIILINNFMNFVFVSTDNGNDVRLRNAFILRIAISVLRYYLR